VRFAEQNKKKCKNFLTRETFSDKFSVVLSKNNAKKLPLKSCSLRFCIALEWLDQHFNWSSFVEAAVAS
jgi:hypothetical protein